MVQFLLLACALVGLTIYGAMQLPYRWKWYEVPRHLWRVIDGEVIWGPLAQGFFVTVHLSLLAMALTLAVGLLVALLRFSDLWAGRWVARIFVQIVRNTPVLVQLFIYYFVLAPILDFDRFTAGVLCLGLFEASFAAEIIRGGILAVPKGQGEAAASLGLSRYQLTRFVVLPQAIPLILPPMTGVLVNLIKHSAIVSAIAVVDLTNEARNVIADTLLSFEIWLTVAGLYLVLTLSLSLLAGLLEWRLARSQGR